MDARTKRALYRFVSFFLATGILTTGYQYITAATVDWKALAGAVVAALVMAGEQWLKESDPATASVTPQAVNTALQTQSVSVPPPSA